MGRFEVLQYLLSLRMVGDDGFYRYAEVHEGMRREGMSYNYTGVWRCLNSLYSEGLVEVVFDTVGLQRTAKFRARFSSMMHSSDMKRVHNILPAVDEKVGGRVPGRSAPPAALAERSGGV